MLSPFLVAQCTPLQLLWVLVTYHFSCLFCWPCPCVNLVPRPFRAFQWCTLKSGNAWCCRLLFTWNIRECLPVSVALPSCECKTNVWVGMPRNHWASSWLTLRFPWFYVANEVSRLFNAHTHAFTGVRGKAQSTVQV